MRNTNHHFILDVHVPFPGHGHGRKGVEISIQSPQGQVLAKVAGHPPAE